MMPTKIEELCSIRMAFEWPGGVAIAQRWITGKLLRMSPQDFQDFLWSQVACALGGPLVDTPVSSLGLILVGLPAPMCYLIREYLPDDPEAADDVAALYTWSGRLPRRPTWRKEGNNGQGA